MSGAPSAVQQERELIPDEPKTEAETASRRIARIRWDDCCHFGSNGPLLFLLGVGLLFISSMLVGLLGEQVYRAQQLATEGLPATGTVVKKIPHAAGGRDAHGTSYELDYVFTAAAGPRLKGRGAVDAVTWEQMKEGGPVDIEYAAARPQINQIGHATMPSIGAYLGVALGAVLWLSGAALACQGLRRARSARVGAEPNNVHTV
jgi:hypothetical protein